MRIITFNANGIRAAARKGFYPWLQQQQADMVCIQELKAQVDQLKDPLFQPQDYYCFYHQAEKKGYSGVGFYAKRQPDNVNIGLGEGWEDIDAEGRYLRADFGKLTVISLYAHSGTSSEERQAKKMDFLARFLPYLEQLRSDNERYYIICGDFNIAHKPIDLKNWRANQKHSGFLPEERAWLDQLFEHSGYLDSFRLVNQEPEQYTWWSNRGKAWDNNTGWRIDYQVISDNLKEKVVAADIYKSQRFSDHAPLILDYKLDLFSC